MYTDKTVSGKQLRPETLSPKAKVVNKPAHAEVTPDANENDAAADMCLGSRDV